MTTPTFTDGADSYVVTAPGDYMLDFLGGDDKLDGGSGADTMVGGTGNDTYTVRDAGDIVVENAGEGTDRVNSSITYTLGAHLENLSLIGTANLTAYGN